MNVNCIICSDLFVPSSDIFGTKCGHVFHYTCLMQWIERSKTCPQCRTKINDRNIFRIYFNIATAEGIQDDAVTLQSKIESLNLNLRIKDNFVKTTEEKIIKVNEEKKILELQLNIFKLECDKYKSGNASLKERIWFYQEQIKNIEQVQKENKIMKENLNAMKKELTALTGTYEETEAIVNTCESVQTLSLISMSLKKELLAMERKRNVVLTKLRRTENELFDVKKDCQQFKKDIDSLQYELLAHKQCQAEIENLKLEISKLIENKTIPINPSLIRVVTESPAPMLTKLKENSDESYEQINSPSLSKRVHDIKQSDSPYLTVKSNCMSMFLKDDLSTRFNNASTSTSIFKKSASSTSTSISPKIVPEGNYNGYGGHSKEDRYPTPKLTGLKRKKSSMLSSKKFKNTDTSNGKLLDFLNTSTHDE